MNLNKFAESSQVGEEKGYGKAEEILEVETKEISEEEVMVIITIKEEATISDN